MKEIADVLLVIGGWGWFAFVGTLIGYKYHLTTTEILQGLVVVLALLALPAGLILYFWPL